MRIVKIILLQIFFSIFLLPTPVFAAVTGAIFTTDSTCTGVNLNIYSNKSAVYLDGGPTHPGAAGLPDGSYYVKVTTPDGTLLGKTLTASVTVSSGEFSSCYQLSAILKSVSSGFTASGYDSTSNPGGEYKVWVSTDPNFAESASKTDNFKIKEVSGSPSPTPLPQATLNVIKFYDANANGINDDSQLITGWKVRIQDGIDLIRFTPATLILDPDDYIISEFSPIQTNWIRTTTNPIGVTLANGDNKTVAFGNVCTGQGGGHTLGFWSNKNGKATMNDGGTLAPELALLSSLNLRNANGSAFDPATYDQFRTWLLSASATNMAYMLSAQLAAMQLNVEAGLVSGSALVYAPGVPGANSLGFISINSLMTQANTQLGAHPVTTSGVDPVNRAIQENIKNALDAANNNQNFVQGTPCPFSFPD